MVLVTRIKQNAPFFLQIGRSSESPIDFVVMDTVPGNRVQDPAKTAAQSTISRSVVHIFMTECSLKNCSLDNSICMCHGSGLFQPDPDPILKENRIRIPDHVSLGFSQQYSKKLREFRPIQAYLRHIFSKHITYQVQILRWI